MQVALFYNAGVCLPWISLLFGATVLVLVQMQRLGGHRALLSVVQPTLSAIAVGATLIKLVLLRMQRERSPQAVALSTEAPDAAYLSGLCAS
jgi:hypothetical protein